MYLEPPTPLHTFLGVLVLLLNHDLFDMRPNGGFFVNDTNTLESLD